MFIKMFCINFNGLQADVQSECHGCSSSPKRGWLHWNEMEVASSFPGVYCEDDFKPNPKHLKWAWRLWCVRACTVIYTSYVKLAFVYSLLFFMKKKKNPMLSSIIFFNINFFLRFIQFLCLFIYISVIIIFK